MSSRWLKWLKWLILWIPTVTIGLWEYLRHTLLLPFVSMELGNVLAPIFVFLITLTLLRPLFAKLEQMQESLQRERIAKAASEERGLLARELHDGISQSLFMLSVKLDKLERVTEDPDARSAAEEIKHTVRQMYEDVRQQVGHLHNAPMPANQSWLQGIHHLTSEMEKSSGIRTSVEWHLDEGALSHKQKVELLAIMREALMNVQKHARAGRVVIRGGLRGEQKHGGGAFFCQIEDDGIGTTDEALNAKGKYGLKMMRSRAEAMKWRLTAAGADPHGTIVTVEGRGLAK